MKKGHIGSKLLVITILAFAALAGCTLDADADDGCEEGESCGTSSGSTKKASSCVEGEYRCASGEIGASSIERCEGGKWTYAAACGCGVKVGDPRKPPYRSSCTIGGTKGTAVCSYAGESCRVCRKGQSSCQDIPQ